MSTKLIKSVKLMDLSAEITFVASLSCVWSLFLTSPSGDQLEVKRAGNVILQCQDPKEAAIKVLEWSRPDLQTDGYVFFYRNNHSYENYQHPLYRGRVELRDESSTKTGDASVILKNVNINDSGTYECRIISNVQSRARMISEYQHVVNLTVEPGNNKEDGGDKDGGDKDGGDKGEGDKDGGGKDGGGKDGGEQRGRVGLVVSLSVFVLHFCVVALIIFRKHKVII